MVSLLDDTRKIPISRLGEHLGIAGTAELAGCHHALDSPTAQTRCTALLRRCAARLRGLADRSEPNYGTGLRPSTPSNIPCIGRSCIHKRWLIASHGTLGWTHGAGSGEALRRPGPDRRSGPRCGR